MPNKFVDELKQLFNEYPDLKINFVLDNWESDFLRFYQSMTNYNISDKQINLHTSVYDGKKSYNFSITNPNIDLVKDQLADAVAILPKLPEDPDFVDLEDNKDLADNPVQQDNITAVPLEKKIEILQAISDAVEPFDFKIYGTFICNRRESYIINSNGVDKYYVISPIMLEVKAVSNKESQVTVLESFGGSSLKDFDKDDFIKRLVDKIKATENEIVDVDPGEYDVILSPKAIGEFFMYMAWGAWAGVLDRKQSFFEGKVGEKVFPDNITLRDEPHNPGLINYFYNGDGHIMKDLTVIENGVFKNFFVNNYYSYKTKLEKNGSAGECLVMSTGDKSLEEMIKGVKKGLFVSSLHYMNFINMKETSVTGLTRDGTFLIEDGKLTKVVNNLRYTEKISDVINGITEIEDKSYTIPSSENYEQFNISSCKMPHVRVKGFKISSSTKTI